MKDGFGETTPGCLNPGEIDRLAREATVGGLAPDADAHVSQCDSCRALLTEAIENERALARLRDSDGAAKGPVDTGAVAIPGFEIINIVNRGGQGIVYEATQTSTGRRVAIKVMREGPFASDADRVRFEREARLLARLKHPNIVTIHDTGVAAGVHFVVMDFIDGPTFESHIDALWRWRADAGARRDPRPLRDALDVFATICEAVNAAHVRGVIHRDIKPSNIRLDQAGVPHVLDFGLAKTADADDSGISMSGSFVGSLPWAAPEQASGRVHAIDVRTDVYALGVVLYQLLTGEFPYAVSGAMRDTLDNIINIEPRRPSAIAGRASRIDDELDTITLRCLTKDPAQRYQTAGDLARDIRRYLAGEPIEAKRDSLAYVVRKQLRRYRIVVGTGVAFLLVVLAGLFVSISQWRQAVTAREHAEKQTARAQAEAKKADAVNDFLGQMLAAVEPDNALGNRDITIREALDLAADQLDAGQLADQPEVEAAVRDTLGTTYSALGEFEAARRHLDRAVALARDFPDQPRQELAVFLNSRGTLLQGMGLPEPSESDFRESLTLAQTMGLEPRSLALCHNNLAMLLAQTGRLDEAYTELSAAHELMQRLGGEAVMDATMLLGNMAVLNLERGDAEAALLQLEENVATWRELLPPNHPTLLEALSNLASAHRIVGNYDEAERRFSECMEIGREVYGDRHPIIGVDLNNLGLTRSEAGRFAEAEVAFRQAWDIQQEALSPGHIDRGKTLGNLADAVAEQGRLEEGLAYYEQCATESKDLNPLIEAGCNIGRAEILLKLERFEEAATLAEPAARALQTMPGVADGLKQRSRAVAAAALRSIGRDEDAAEFETP
ncbi:MAG: tetratricopeptide repeat protein [Phycisphaerales bacterium]|nr:tetratricopeptide repeat protein [Phycisphaerales bacterium]